MIEGSKKLSAINFIDRLDSLGRVALDDDSLLHRLYQASNALAKAEVPQEIAEALVSARLTALRKPQGGVRGIATGTAFRRLVARTLARQFLPEVEDACAPFQFALSTRAGTDCVGHAVRLLTDLGPNATLLSIVGVGAYDNVRRMAMLSKLDSLPKARAMLPFVCRTPGATKAAIRGSSSRLKVASKVTP